MIVSHAHRFIFFRNPKCAGMSFRQTLQPYHDDPVSFWGAYQAAYVKTMIDHSHLRLWELPAQIWFWRLGDRRIPRQVIPMQGGSAFIRAGLAALGLPDLEVPSIKPSLVDFSAGRAAAVARRFVGTFYTDDMTFLPQ